jgi:hypothetical protein
MTRTRHRYWESIGRCEFVCLDSSSHRTDTTAFRSLLHMGANIRPEMDRATGSGPLPPGGWVTSSTPREEKGDVSTQSYKLFPPTIQEHPNQEPDVRLRRMSRSTQKPSQMYTRGREPERDAAYRSTERATERKTEEVTMGVMGHTAKTDGSGAMSNVDTSASPGGGGIIAPKPKPGRRETAMSGWVMVNVEGAASSQSTPSQTPSRSGKSSSQSPPVSRPNVRHRRSNSDSGLMRPQMSPSPVGNAPVPAAMSAAAKTIVMMDAVEAKREEEEKSSAPSGLRRIFHRMRESESDGGGGKTATLRRKLTPEGGSTKGKGSDREVSDEKPSFKEKAKGRGIPPTTKSGTTRVSID